MAGHSYVSHKHKLVVLWSPKCACTSVVDWLFHIEGIPDTLHKRKWLYEHGYLYSYLQSRHLAEDLGYCSIHFVRNPYSRAVSAFLNKFFIYYGSRIVDFSRLEHFSQLFINGHNEANNLEPDVFHGISFVQYLEHVERLMMSQEVINLHWDSQLPRELAFRIIPDYVVKQETFSDDLLAVGRGLKLPSYTAQNLNKTTYPEDFTKSSFDEAGTNSLTLLENTALVNQDNLLNESTRAKIYQLYEEDFTFFNYSREEGLKPSLPLEAKGSWFRKMLGH